MSIQVLSKPSKAISYGMNSLYPKENYLASRDRKQETQGINEKQIHSKGKLPTKKDQQAPLD